LSPSLRLSGQWLSWFAAEEFTAADIQISFVVQASAARGGLDHRRPKLMAWLERIHARSAYNRALDEVAG